MLRYFLVILISIILVFSLWGNKTLSGKADDNGGCNNYEVTMENWIDSVFNSLTLDQRIAQLFIIAADSNRGEANNNYLERIITRYTPGGVCFFKGTPEAQAELTNRLQILTQVPLFVAMDAEWGPAMRLEGVVAFPHQITLGAITDSHLVRQMGLGVGKQLRRIGVNMSFSPVIDVNSNPKNPVINFRSFGESRENVSVNGIAYMKGLHDAGIIAVAKHFPGHGDSKTDSHYGLPSINLTKGEIDSIHIYPFRKLIANGLNAIMTAHIEVPAIDPQENIPASLSKPIIAELLQTKLGFQGLVITDALNMAGATSGANQGSVELKALQAGNDILLMPQSLPTAIRHIKEALQNEQLCQDDIDKKVKKILKHKYLLGLINQTEIALSGIEEDLNHNDFVRLNQQLALDAITLLHNPNHIIPLKSIGESTIALLSIGAPIGNPFQQTISESITANHYSISKIHSRSQTNQILQTLENYDLVIVSIHRSNISIGRNYGVNSENIYLANQLAKQQPTIVTVFANPYSLSAFGQDIMESSAVILAYQDGTHFEKAAAKVIVGKVGSKGKLPVSLEPLFPLFKGHKTMDNFRVNFWGNKSNSFAKN